MAAARSKRRKAGRRAAPQAAAPQAELEWHSPAQAPFRLAGFAWFASDRVYRRLPVKPVPAIPPNVDYLANQTAGGQVHFRTDSPRLAVKVQLLGPPGMSHMPATGQCGFDCYVGPAGARRLVGVAVPPLGCDAYECNLVQFPHRRMRDVTLNFPLYQGVKEVQVGVEKGSKIAAPPRYRSDLRAVFYGTSITQGGCACRPGMAYTNILSRRFDLEFINLGFSGGGRGEPEVARVIAQIPDPACFVLDYEANCRDKARMKETLPEFIRILRAAHPQVPILVLSVIRGTGEIISAASRRARMAVLEVERRTVEGFRKKGDRLVFFEEGADFMGEDFEECTVDGGHPTDLGFLRMADALTPIMAKLLRRCLR